MSGARRAVVVVLTVAFCIASTSTLWGGFFGRDKQEPFTLVLFATTDSQGEIEPCG
jgi:hypothetical protein